MCLDRPVNRYGAQCERRNSVCVNCGFQKQHVLSGPEKPKSLKAFRVGNKKWGVLALHDVCGFLMLNSGTRSWKHWYVYVLHWLL